MKGKATITKKQKLGRETAKLVVQKNYTTRMYESGISPPRRVLRALLPWLTG